MKVLLPAFLGIILITGGLLPAFMAQSANAQSSSAPLWEFGENLTLNDAFHYHVCDNNLKLSNELGIPDDGCYELTLVFINKLDNNGKDVWAAQADITYEGGDDIRALLLVQEDFTVQTTFEHLAFSRSIENSIFYLSTVADTPKTLAVGSNWGYANSAKVGEILVRNHDNGVYDVGYKIVESTIFQIRDGVPFPVSGVLWTGLGGTSNIKSFEFRLQNVGLSANAAAVIDSEESVRELLLTSDRFSRSLYVNFLTTYGSIPESASEFSNLLDLDASTKILLSTPDENGILAYNEILHTLNGTPIDILTILSENGVSLYEMPERYDPTAYLDTFENEPRYLVNEIFIGGPFYEYGSIVEEYEEIIEEVDEIIIEVEDENVIDDELLQELISEGIIPHDFFNEEIIDDVFVEDNVSEDDVLVDEEIIIDNIDVVELIQEPTINAEVDQVANTDLINMIQLTPEEQAHADSLLETFAFDFAFHNEKAYRVINLESGKIIAFFVPNDVVPDLQEQSSIFPEPTVNILQDTVTDEQPIVNIIDPNVISDESEIEIVEIETPEETEAMETVMTMEEISQEIRDGEAFTLVFEQTGDEKLAAVMQMALNDKVLSSIVEVEGYMEVYEVAFKEQGMEQGRLAFVEALGLQEYLSNGIIPDAEPVIPEQLPEELGFRIFLLTDDVELETMVIEAAQSGLINTEDVILAESTYNRILESTGSPELAKQSLLDLLELDRDVKDEFEDKDGDGIPDGLFDETPIIEEEIQLADDDYLGLIIATIVSIPDLFIESLESVFGDDFENVKIDDIG